MTSLARRARAIADVTSGIVLASVEIAAPPERVFDALTTDEVCRWWGSADTYRTTEWNADLRVGGRWRSSGRGSDGTPFSVEGEYLAVERPHRLVFTWRPDWDGGQTSTVSCSLDAIAGGTRLTLRHEGLAGRPEACQGHAAGWERVLGWLTGHASAPDEPAKKYFLCRLLGPRPTFPADMTPAEAEVMHQHADYWRRLAAAGTALVVGPVADPKGVWGVCVVEVDDAAQVNALWDEDPTIRSGLGFRYEAMPMLGIILRN